MIIIVFWKDKKVWVGGKPVVHKEGERTGLMYHLVELRRTEPTVKELLSKLHVMGQPSGYVGQVIMSWHLEHQAEQFLIEPRGQGLIHRSWSV